MLVTASWLRAEFPATQPYPGVEYWHEQRREPEQSLHIVKIDLANPKVNLRVATAGEDPDGEGPWQTTLLPVPTIATRERFDIGVNASFFEVNSTAPVRPAFVEGMPAKSVGWTMIDGKLISPAPREGWPIVWIDAGPHVRMGMQRNLPRDARHILTGNGMILINGQPPERFEGNLVPRHPRTVLGIDRTGTKLIVLILDGRRAGVSVGMTGSELSAEMHRLGCWDAINLDGGGSTTLVMRNPENDQFKVINQPSDDRPRAVSNAIGIRIEAPQMNADEWRQKLRRPRRRNQ